MILPIYLYGQPVLRKQAEEIENTPELKQFIADMYETLTQAEGCGLAAPQVGRSWRLFVVDGTELAEDYPECKDFKRAFTEYAGIGQGKTQKRGEITREMMKKEASRVASQPRRKHKQREKTRENRR